MSETREDVLAAAKAVDGLTLTVPERYAWVQRLRAAGLTYADMGRELGRGWHRNTILYAVRQCGAVRRHAQYAPLTSRQQELVALHLRDAVRYARPFARRFARQHADDFRAAALLGLCDAAQKWDPARGEFTRYFPFRLKKSLLEHASHIVSSGFAPVRNVRHTHAPLVSLSAPVRGSALSFGDTLCDPASLEPVHSKVLEQCCA